MNRLWLIVLMALAVGLLLGACAHFPVHPGECPYLSGYGTQHVLDAADPECKLRCLQTLAYDCWKYGPTPQ